MAVKAPEPEVFSGPNENQLKVIEILDARSEEYIDAIKYTMKSGMPGKVTESLMKRAEALKQFK